MQKVVVWLVLVAILTLQVPVKAAEETYSEGLAAGKQAAQNYTAVPLGVVMFVLTALDPMKGLLVAGLAVVAPPVPEKLLIELPGSSDYKKGFVDGYKQEVISKQLTASAIGMGVGLLANIVLDSASQTRSLAPSDNDSIPVAGVSVNF
ncbi:MAG: hypothetical protein QJR13_02560 [Bacillota bacterium]|nr:hypothetical protein [Bacillota bacterium]